MVKRSDLATSRTEPNRNSSQGAEIRLDLVTGSQRDRRHAGTSGHHLTSLQHDVQRRQLIDEPCQCDPQIAKHVFSAAGQGSPAVDGGLDRMVSKADRPPGRLGCGPKNEEMAQALSARSCGAPA